MKRFNRSQRVSEELLKEVSAIIRTDMKDPRIGDFVSLTRAQVSKDLRHASVFVSVYGEDSVKQATMAALASGAGFIRCLVGKRMRIRMTPEIKFHLDDSMEYSARIADILKEISSDPD